MHNFVLLDKILKGGIENEMGISFCSKFEEGNKPISGNYNIECLINLIAANDIIINEQF